MWANSWLLYVENSTHDTPEAWLVENGYAVVMTIPPNVKHEGLFRRLQREAREAGRGLWTKGKGG